VYGGTADVSGIFKRGTFEILPPHRWPDQNLLRLVEMFEVTARARPRRW
jgi:hypothetical protein